MGVPAAGKSSLTRMLCDKHNARIVSRDAIRFSKLMPGDDYFKYEDDVINEYYDTINTELRNSDCDMVIADATHVSKKSRREFWRCVHIPKDVKVIGVWVEIPKKVAISRNANREGLAKVPDNVIYNMYKSMVKPQSHEPFDDVIFIDNTCDAPVIRDLLDKI